MRDKRELWISLVFLVLISAIYLTVLLREGVPAASELFGHSLGVIGFILMLSTETLYSLRKRVIRRPLGRLQTWLRFHIFSGIVGPYLVLLHTAWHFRGLAGVVLLFTMIVVISGFVGRYIYTAVPRTADGMVLEEEAVRSEIDALEVELRRLESQLPEGLGMASLLPYSSGLFSWVVDLRSRVKRWWMRPKLSKQLSEAVEQVIVARRRSRDLRRSLNSLAAARRMLAVWHSVHIPLGMALFVTAFFHIGAALYYATLLH